MSLRQKEILPRTAGIEINFPIAALISVRWVKRLVPKAAVSTLFDEPYLGILHRLVRPSGSLKFSDWSTNSVILICPLSPDVSDRRKVAHHDIIRQLCFLSDIWAATTCDQTFNDDSGDGWSLLMTYTAHGSSYAESAVFMSINVYILSIDYSNSPHLGLLM